MFLKLVVSISWTTVSLFNAPETSAWSIIIRWPVSSRHSFLLNGLFRSIWSDASISSCNSRNTPETSSRNINGAMPVQQPATSWLSSPVRCTHADRRSSTVARSAWASAVGRRWPDLRAFRPDGALGWSVTRPVLLGHSTSAKPLSCSRRAAGRLSIYLHRACCFRRWRVVDSA